MPPSKICSVSRALSDINMSNFRCRLRDAARILATDSGEIKYRLQSAISDQLILANIPEKEDLPSYFKESLDAIITMTSLRSWSEHSEDDRIRATLHGKHGRTLSKIAEKIWDLHREYEEFLASGFIPSNGT